MNFFCVKKRKEKSNKITKECWNIICSADCFGKNMLAKKKRSFFFFFANAQVLLSELNPFYQSSSKVTIEIFLITL
jgi:hypothetical protein